MNIFILLLVYRFIDLSRFICYFFQFSRWIRMLPINCLNIIQEVIVWSQIYPTRFFYFIFWYRFPVFLEPNFQKLAGFFILLFSIFTFCGEAISLPKDKKYDLIDSRFENFLLLGMNMLWLSWLVVTINQQNVDHQVMILQEWRIILYQYYRKPAVWRIEVLDCKNKGCHSPFLINW